MRCVQTFKSVRITAYGKNFARFLLQNACDLEIIVRSKNGNTSAEKYVYQLHNSCLSASSSSHHSLTLFQILFIVNEVCIQ